MIGLLSSKLRRRGNQVQQREGCVQAGFQGRASLFFLFRFSCFFWSGSNQGLSPGGFALLFRKSNWRCISLQAQFFPRTGDLCPKRPPGLG